MSNWISSPHSEYDQYLFHQGNHCRSYQFLGAHCCQEDGVNGVRFALWAPRAKNVQIVGDFNHWIGDDHNLDCIAMGIWVIFVPGLQAGTVYKYAVEDHRSKIRLKADPYGFYHQVAPATASIVYDLSGYQWQDKDWQDSKEQYNCYESPMLIYEVHLGSWKQKGEEQYYTYRELADELIDYVIEMGYTHIELLPVVEHPFGGSWGYQATGFFAPTSRYGNPQDFMYFVNLAHQKRIGVILDWVPSHFCKDNHGLRRLDGTCTYEYEDRIKRDNVGWGTSNFDLGRPEVQSFLLSSAYYWLEVYHIDGLRVDAVANMLYLDYGREDGQWQANQYGGRENMEGVEFLKKLNAAIFKEFTKPLIIAEESTSWPLVSKPTYLGGLGFNYKWNMGWMNDILEYMELDAIHRKNHHNLLTFSLMYAFSENFILPLSHDEVVHGKRSLLDKMPGDYWQKFAGLRAFYGYMMAHPGKKLLFMGGEYGQFVEWKYHESLDWHLLEYPMHQKMLEYVKALNYFYLDESCLWELDHDCRGFEWIDPDDTSQSVVSFIRKGKSDQFIVVVSNFTSVVRDTYRIGVPLAGAYSPVFNSDSQRFGGSGQENADLLHSEPTPWHKHDHSLVLKIPPLATVYLKPEFQR